MMVARQWFGCLSLVMATTVTGQSAAFGQVTEGSFRKEITQTVEGRYLVHLPQGYDATPGKRWPLILFLHGAGERGSDPGTLKGLGPLRYAAENPAAPFIILAPICPSHQSWSVATLNALLDHILETHRADADRVYLTGFSMGGHGSWELGIANPERFAAIAPLCGRNIPLLGFRLWQMPLWVFHGEQDDVVPVQFSKDMAASLESMGNKQIKLTLYPDFGHDIWTFTYLKPELYEWFLQHKRSDREKSKE